MRMPAHRYREKRDREEKKTRTIRMREIDKMNKCTSLNHFYINCNDLSSLCLIHFEFKYSLFCYFL